MVLAMVPNNEDKEGHNLNLYQLETSNLTQSTSIFYINSNGQGKFLYLRMVHMKVTNCKTISEKAN